MTENENESNSSSAPAFMEYIQTQSGLAFLGFFALALILGSWAAFRYLDDGDTVSGNFEGISSSVEVKAIEAVEKQDFEEITVTAPPIEPTPAFVPIEPLTVDMD